MKLKDFLKQFEGLDPEIEVGIGYDGHLVRKLKLEYCFVNDEILKEEYNPTKYFEPMGYYNTKALMIARIAE